MNDVGVAILGTGPSAAYAAMACNDASVSYDIISNRSPVMHFPGAFWPRLNLTGAPIPKVEVKIYSVGTAEGYLRKQWGEVSPEWLKETSFPIKARTELAYNPYELFRPFWATKNIHLVEGLSDEAIADIAKEYAIVFMTFATQKSREAMKPYSIRYPIASYKYSTTNHHYCIYNGEEPNHIVRMSSLFGYIHLEYSKDYIPKTELVGDGQITWVPDTLPDTPEWDLADVPAKNVFLIGRYAQWKRKVLSHDAYAEVQSILVEALDA